MKGQDIDTGAEYEYRGKIQINGQGINAGARFNCRGRIYIQGQYIYIQGQDINTSAGYKYRGRIQMNGQCIYTGARYSQRSRIQIQGQYMGGFAQFGLNQLKRGKKCLNQLQLSRDIDKLKSWNFVYCSITARLRFAKVKCSVPKCTSNMYIYYTKI